MSDTSNNVNVEHASSSDASLVRRFNRGEEDAATELYLRYATRLTRLAQKRMSHQLSTRVDAEDVVQSVFRTFFRRANEGLFRVPPGDQLWQLLLVIATNKVRHLGRFHRQTRRDVTRTVSSTPSTEPEKMAGDHAPYAVLEMVVSEALSDLPDLQRRMIEMRIQGHGAEEIAQATGRCTRTVERVLRRFRDTMTRYIEEPSDGADALPERV